MAIFGILVPSRDPLSLANAIEKLLLNPDQLLSMGLAARTRAENLFDINIMYKNILLSILIFFGPQLFMNLFVTGSSGFVGRRACITLSRAGYSVAAFSRSC